MHTFAYLGLGLVVLLLAAFAMSARDQLRKQLSTTQTNRYQKKDALFTAAEYKFRTALDVAVQGRYRIFGQVRVADVLEPALPRNSKAWWSAFAGIQSKSFDFVLCDPATFSIVAAIKLDDSTHSRRDRRDRDIKLDEMCSSAQLPLIHFKARGSYDISGIRRELEGALGPDKTRSTHTTNKPCPNCGHALERLEGKEGALAGRPIWRGSRYPDCRTVIPAQVS